MTWPARPSAGAARFRDERGNAIVEFQTVGLLLLLPLIYLLLVVLEVQRASFGATQAAREGGRVFAASADVAGAHYAAAVALNDQGLEYSDAAISLSCARVQCFTPGEEVRVSVSVDVPLPILPSVLVGAVNAVVPVRAEHVVVVDRFREAP